MLISISKQSKMYYFVGDKNGHWRYPVTDFYFCLPQEVVGKIGIKWINKKALSTGKLVFWPHIVINRETKPLRYHVNPKLLKFENNP